MLKRLCCITVFSFICSNLQASSSNYFIELTEEEGERADVSSYLSAGDINIVQIFRELRFIVDMNDRTKARELKKPEYEFILSVKEYVEGFYGWKNGSQQIDSRKKELENAIVGMIIKTSQNKNEDYWRGRLTGVPGTRAAKDYMEYKNARFKRALCAAGRGIKIAFGCMMGPISVPSARTDSSDFERYNFRSRDRSDRQRFMDAIE